MKTAELLVLSSLDHEFGLLLLHAELRVAWDDKRGLVAPVTWLRK